MELVRGAKITEYCDQSRLPTAGRLELFIQVCHAVQHAHQKGIIHRDLKPSNILVTTSAEGKPLAKVIDFGIAKATTGLRLTDKTLFTAFEMLIGTPAYMSPEQAALTSVDVDTRTDIYSLGVLLYELLTSTTPFDTRELLKAGLDEVRRVIQSEEPVRPSTRLRTMMAADLTIAGQCRQAEPPKLIRSLKGDLDWIVMKALEKDRTRRYQTAASLAEDIEHYLASDTVSARPPSAFYKLQKAVLRNKLLFAGIGIIVVLLVTGLGIATWLLAGENRARREAEVARVQAEADKKTAQTEAAKSRQVTQFLEEMLNGVGPSAALGQDTTMLREILDKTAGRITTELTNQPAVEAELSGEIGRVYGQLWLFDQAEAMDRLALAGYQKLFSNENLNVASSLSDLAFALRQQRKFAEAETDYRKSLAIRRKLLGDEHPDVAKSLTCLATVLWRERKLGDAETLCREALAMQRKLLGGTNLDVAETLNSLAVVLAQQGKLPEAELQFREALEMRRKLHGDDHPQVAETLKNLGNTIYQEGKLAEAETIYRDALAIQRRVRTDEHPATLTTLDALLTTLAGQGKELGNAEPLLNEFLTPAFVAKPQSAPFLFRRADLLARRGRWSEAEADAAKALAYEPTDHMMYHTLAPLLVVTHDVVNYQKLCQRIVTRFAGATDAGIADRMAKDCLILPSSGVDLQTVGELAETSVTVGRQDISAPRFRCCKALAEYRQGHFASAVEWARLAATNRFPNSQAAAFAILSMGQYKLNQVDAAHTNLSNCENVVLTQLPGLGAQDLGIDWRDWIIAHALLTEAQNLLGDPPAGLHSSPAINK